MTNEEAKAFLDNLEICIIEHPIVADWLVEIKNRKVEPNCSEKPNNCEWSVGNMHNKDIRDAIESAGLKYWEVAERIGIDSCNFSKWLRRELTGERLQRTLEAIEELKREKSVTSSQKANQH